MNKKQLYDAPSIEVLELHLKARVLTVSDPNLRGGVDVDDYSGFGSETEL